MCRSLSEGGRRCPSSRPHINEGKQPNLPQIVKPWNGPRVPVDVYTASPTPEQRKAIEQWSDDLRLIGSDGRFTRAAAGMSLQERRDIRRMGRDQFIDHLHNKLAEYRTEITVSGIPKGHNLSSADPTLVVVNDIGDRAHTWVAAQEPVRSAMAKHREAIRKYNTAPLKHSTAMHGFARVAATIAVARREVIPALLADVVGTSHVISAPMGSSWVDKSGQFLPGDDDINKGTDILLREVSPLIPDWLKKNAEANCPPLHIFMRKGRERYHATTSLPSDPYTPISVVETSLEIPNLAHEMMHRMEHGSPHLTAMESAWLTQRCGKNAQLLQWGDDEDAPCHDGKLISAYIGKVYPSGFREVLSTGIETLLFHRYGAGVGAGVDAGNGGCRTDQRTQRITQDLGHLYFTLGALLTVPKV